MRGVDLNKKFSNYPIVIKNINNFTKSWYKSLINNIGKLFYALNFFRFLFSIVLVSFSPYYSILIDKLLSDFAYMRLLNGVYLTVPEILFYSMSTNDFVVGKFPNPFASFAANRTCRTKQTFVENQIECNILMNFGRQLMFLMVMLMINTGITLSYYFITRYLTTEMKRHNIVDKIAQQKLLKAKKFWRIIYWMHKNYGIRFFMIHMDGVCFEVISYSYVTFATRPANAPLMVGFAFAFFCILFYASVCMTLIFFVKQVDQSLKEASFNRGVTRQMPNKLEKAIDLTQFKFGLFDFIFEDFKYPIQDLYLYNHLFKYFRVFVIGYLVFSFADAGYTQGMLILLVQGAYLFYTYKANLSSNTSKRVFECINICCHLVYIFCKILMFVGFDEKINQPIFGIISCMVIVIVICLNFCYVLIVVFFGAIWFIKKWIKEYKTSTKKNKMRESVRKNLNGFNNLNVINNMIRKQKITMMESEDQGDAVYLDDDHRKALKMHKEKDTLVKINMISRAARGHDMSMSTMGRRLNKVTPFIKMKKAMVKRMGKPEKEQVYIARRKEYRDSTGMSDAKPKKVNLEKVTEKSLKSEDKLKE